MQYDFSIRKPHYFDLVQEIERLGYQTELFLDENESDALAVATDKTPCDPFTPYLFLVAYRLRGWHIIIRGPKYYKVPSSLSVIEICTDLLKSDPGSLTANFRDGQLLERYPLQVVSTIEWREDEHFARTSCWKKHGWIALNPEEEEKTWKWFEVLLKSPDGELQIPQPTKTWNLAPEQFKSSVDRLKNEESLTCVLLDCLRKCTGSEERILALEWDHPCYSLIPHNMPIDRPYRDYWAISPWPSKSSYLLEPTLKFGIVSQWNGMLTIFGKQFVQLAEPLISQRLSKCL